MSNKALENFQRFLTKSLLTMMSAKLSRRERELIFAQSGLVADSFAHTAEVLQLERADLNIGQDEIAGFVVGFCESVLYSLANSDTVRGLRFERDKDLIGEAAAAKLRIADLDTTMLMSTAAQEMKARAGEIAEDLFRNRIRLIKD